MTLQRPDEDLGAAFARLQQGLRGYLRRRLHDSAQADDLLQDIFVKALASRRAGRKVENLAGWLYAAARTTVVDHYRARGAQTEALDEDAPASGPDETLLHQELAACLRPFAERLPPIYRDTLIATEFEGVSMRALADRQNVSVSAIKSRAARARAMLKASVLACCKVEMAGGLVSDYRRVSPSGCDGACF